MPKNTSHSESFQKRIKHVLHQVGEWHAVPAPHMPKRIIKWDFQNKFICETETKMWGNCFNSITNLSSSKDNRRTWGFGSIRDGDTFWRRLNQYKRERKTVIDVISIISKKTVNCLPSLASIMVVIKLEYSTNLYWTILFHDRIMVPYVQYLFLQISHLWERIILS